MKKLILAILLFSIFQVSNAQEEETINKYVVGGSFNFISQNNTFPLGAFSITSVVGGVFSTSTSESKNTSFSLTPYIGKEINAHWLAGLQFDYGSSSYTVERNLFSPSGGEFKRTTNQLGFGLFARYMVNPKNKVVFFLQPATEYNTLTDKEFLDNLERDEEKATFFEAKVDLGIVYNVSDNVRLLLRNGGLLFISGKWEDTDSEEERDFSSFSTTLNLSNVFFGVELRL